MATPHYTDKKTSTAHGTDVARATHLETVYHHTGVTFSTSYGEILRV